MSEEVTAYCIVHEFLGFAQGSSLLASAHMLYTASKLTLVARVLLFGTAWSSGAVGRCRGRGAPPAEWIVENAKSVSSIPC